MAPQEWIVLRHCFLDFSSHHCLHTTERHMGRWTRLESRSRRVAHWRDSRSLDRIKVTLTALGGVGAVGYLVIKYRERAALERGEADEKLVRAVQQLGDASPQVRIAGVYALADVADTYEGPYHQRVVEHPLRLPAQPTASSRIQMEKHVMHPIRMDLPTTTSHSALTAQLNQQFYRLSLTIYDHLAPIQTITMATAPPQDHGVLTE